MLNWRSGGEPPCQQNNPVGGTTDVEPQRARAEAEGILVPATECRQMSNSEAAEAADQARQQGRCTWEDELVGEVEETTSVMHAPMMVQIPAIGGAVHLPSASAVGADCELEGVTRGASLLPVKVAAAVTPIVVPLAPWQGVSGKVELKPSAPDVAPRRGVAACSEAARSTLPAKAPTQMPAQVSSALQQVRLGNEWRSPAQGWRTPGRQQEIKAQRVRMQVYAQAARSQQVDSRAGDTRVRQVRWAQGEAGPSRQSPVRGLPRSVAPVEASAFCVGGHIPSVTKHACDAGVIRVLILFAGRERTLSLCRCLRMLGTYVETFELLDDRRQDLTQRDLQLDILRRIRAGEFEAVFVATPCASFCAALEPQLRSMSDDQIMGKRSLPRRWRSYLQRHNKMVYFTATVIRAATQAAIEWVVENPASQREGLAAWAEHADKPSLWDVPEIAAAMQEASAGSVTFAQCQFGSEYRKYTTLASSPGVGAQLQVAFEWARCTCVKHKKVAKGLDDFGDSLSMPSGEYPPAMNAEIAYALHRAARAKLGVQPLQSAPVGLHVGSSDPHMLRLDDDKAPRSRKAPTFSMTMHEAASKEELLGRPLPVLNAPATTEAAAPPFPQPEGAPIVRDFDDLLKPRWASRLRAWVKRCHRCIRLSQAGRFKMARKLRPPDLWMSAHECMLPSTLPWDWDLRPWSRGESAVPTLRSSRDDNPPIVSFARSVVAADLDSGEYSDKAILAELLHGVCDDVVGPRGSFLCAPHQGGLRYADEAASRLQAGVAEGWAAEYSQIPFWPLRCDPYSVADESERAGKPKFRLTNDHSWPPPGTVPLGYTADGMRFLPSLNAAMDRDDWPTARMLRVREVTESIGILAASECPVAVGAVDITAFYKSFGRQVAEHYRNGAMTADGVLIDERCCFGSAADATKCCRVSDYIVWRARRALREVDARYPTRDPRVHAWVSRRRQAGLAAGATAEEIRDRWTALFSVGMYVDDAAHASINDLLFDADGAPLLRDGRQVTRATAHYEALLGTLRELGLVPTKEQPPGDSVELLGVMISVSENRMRLAPRKRARYASLAAAVAAERVCDRDSYVSLLGKLTFASICYPRGRQWMHAAWRAARATFRLQGDKVVVTKAVRADLRRWERELLNADHPGVPLAATQTFPASDSERAVCVYADAAGAEAAEGGFGAWAVRGNELLFVEGQWTPRERELLIISELELAASTFGLVALVPQVGVRHCYSFTDNTNAMGAMRNLTPKRSVEQALTAARLEWMAATSVAEAVERITSKANTWADWLSRGRLHDVLRQARLLGLTPRRVEVPPEWRRLPLAAAEPPAEGGCMPHTCAASAPLDDTASPRVGRSGDGRCAAQSGGADVGRACGATRPLHGGVDSGSAARPCRARSQVVAEVHGLRAEAAAVDRAGCLLAPRCQASGGGAPAGFCGVAGHCVPRWQADICQDCSEVHATGDALAQGDVPLGVLRRPRLVGHTGDVQSGGGAGAAAESLSQVGRQDERPGSGVQDVSVVARRRCDVESDALHRILRLAAWRRDGPPAGNADRPAGAPDAKRPQVLQIGANGAAVRGADDAQGQGHRRGQRYSSDLGRRRRDDRCGRGAVGDGAGRPHPGRSGGDNTPLSQGARHGGDDGRASPSHQDTHGADRTRSAQVWRAQPQDWRCDGGAGRRPVAGTDPSGWPVGQRRIPDLHAPESAGGAASGADDWLVGLPRGGAHAGIHRRRLDFHVGGDAPGGCVLPGCGRHPRDPRGGGRGVTRSVRDRLACLAARWHAGVPAGLQEGGGSRRGEERTGSIRPYQISHDPIKLGSI